MGLGALHMLRGRDGQKARGEEGVLMGSGRVGDRVPGSFLLVWEVSFSLSRFHPPPSLFRPSPLLLGGGVRKGEGND